MTRFFQFLAFFAIGSNGAILLAAAHDFGLIKWWLYGAIVILLLGVVGAIAFNGNVQDEIAEFTELLPSVVGAIALLVLTGFAIGTVGGAFRW